MSKSISEMKELLDEGKITGEELFKEAHDKAIK